ncbi:glycoside hydrolase family 76 protein [Sphingobacterium sp. LRF_L2]|uniref:glycoside hydrolase family 76 protein n=1 Tax=Sphingobacterium sp. LRF_L2 TaxID=3369421 RepID=UPI003F622C05
MRKLFFLLLFCNATYLSGQDAGEILKAFNAQYLHPQRQIYMVYPQSDKVAAIWTQAIYWDVLMRAYKNTPDKESAALLKSVYDGNYRQYDGFNWNNTDVWFIYDDIQWWVISLARAYLLTDDKNYLAQSILGFDRVWNGSPKVADKGAFDVQHGGMFWGWKSDQRGKTACINYPTVVAALLLYEATKDEAYLDKAKAIYSWSRNNLFDQKSGKVGDHQVPGQATNWTVNLYNQATCIGAAVLLYEQLHEQSFLDDAIRCANYVKDEMCDRNGVLPYKTGIEQGIYTAIFAEYMTMLLPHDKNDVYRKWLEKNAHLAWKNRNSEGIMGKDFNAIPDSKTEVYDASSAVALFQILDEEKR